MPPKITSPAAVMATPLLQVVPKTVEFSDVENDNELSSVVTVIVSLVNRSTIFLPEKVFYVHRVLTLGVCCHCRISTPERDCCAGSLPNPQSFGYMAWLQPPTWHQACDSVSR